MNRLWISSCINAYCRKEILANTAEEWSSSNNLKWNQFSVGQLQMAILSWIRKDNFQELTSCSDKYSCQSQANLEFAWVLTVMLASLKTSLLLFSDYFCLPCYAPFVEQQGPSWCHYGSMCLIQTCKCSSVFQACPPSLCDFCQVQEAVRKEEDMNKPLPQKLSSGKLRLGNISSELKGHLMCRRFSWNLWTDLCG